MSKNLVVIPARGGSKGILRKNLREVGGVSLLSRAIRIAKLWGRADRIIVSSDDDEILQIAEEEGAEVCHRPPHLATAESSTVETVLHCIDNTANDFSGDSTIFLLEPTAPFRTVEQLSRCAALHELGSYKSVVTVCDLERKPENILENFSPIECPSEHYRKLLNDSNLSFSRRQEMAHLKRIAGSIYVINTDLFLRERSFIVEPLGCVWVDQIGAVNIDSVIDLIAANAIVDYYEQAINVSL